LGVAATALKKGQSFAEATELFIRQKGVPLAIQNFKIMARRSDKLPIEAWELELALLELSLNPGETLNNVLKNYAQYQRTMKREDLQHKIPATGSPFQILGQLGYQPLATPAALAERLGHIPDLNEIIRAVAETLPENRKESLRNAGGGTMVRTWTYARFWAGLTESAARLGGLYYANREWMHLDATNFLIVAALTFLLPHLGQFLKRDKNGARTSVVTTAPYWVVAIADAVAAYFLPGLGVVAAAGVIALVTAFHYAVNHYMYAKAMQWKKQHSTAAGRALLAAVTGPGAQVDVRVDTTDPLALSAAMTIVPSAEAAQGVQTAFRRATDELFRIAA